MSFSGLHQLLRFYLTHPTFGILYDQVFWPVPMFYSSFSVYFNFCNEVITIFWIFYNNKQLILLLRSQTYNKIIFCSCSSIWVLYWESHSHLWTVRFFLWSTRPSLETKAIPPSHLKLFQELCEELNQEHPTRAHEIFWWPGSQWSRFLSIS